MGEKGLFSGDFSPSHFQDPECSGFILSGSTVTQSGASVLPALLTRSAQHRKAGKESTEERSKGNEHVDSEFLRYLGDK